MGFSQEVKLQPIDWDQSAEFSLMALHRDDATAILEYKADVQSGKSQLWAIMDGDIRRGSVVTRFDGYQSGRKDFVIVAAVGRVRGISLADMFLSGFEDLARKNNCTHVRYHSGRRGMIKLAERNGYREQERVFVKGL